MSLPASTMRRKTHFMALLLKANVVTSESRDRAYGVRSVSGGRLE
jgi:hypothetical protein